MSNKTNAIGRILAKPMQPGTFRKCLECRAWFALIKVAKRDDKLQGSVTTYRCKKCGATIHFADIHPTDAV
jgi:DNA-directed RNA polymerase subunit RPC12/RpoP